MNTFFLPRVCVASVVLRDFLIFAPASDLGHVFRCAIYTYVPRRSWRVLLQYVGTLSVIHERRGELSDLSQRCFAHALYSNYCLKLQLNHWLFTFALHSRGLH